jgi:hypothetical protein
MLALNDFFRKETKVPLELFRKKLQQKLLLGKGFSEKRRDSTFLLCGAAAPKSSSFPRGQE